ncbi:uncharacterized protein [Ptychodera flava]|uniref:uncharacterized protein isoform X2 n=1 Tax=Ptychodera flava TaxID=63121 RepID=UPI00396A5E15
MPTSELLSYAVEPPSMEKFDAAVESLAEVGALTKNSEHADITLLGYVALQLPVDMGLSRLVVYGVLFNCTCDAVVMAAALSLRMDPFSLPSIMVMKDPHKFWPSLEKSFKARAKFDNGQYSEPLMYVNMFKAWLKEREKDNRKSILSKSRQRFCARNALIMERLAEMESSVCEIASRLHRYLQSDSKACKDIAYLLSLLKSEIADSDDDSLDDGKGSGKGQDKQKQEKGKTKSPAKTDSTGQQKILAKTSGKMDGKSASENGHLSSEAGPSTSQNSDITTPVDTLFSSDTMLLKMLQVAAFNPCYLVGRHDWPPPDGRERLFNRTEREEQNIKSLCYDPACTIILNNMNPILCREDKKKVLSQILDLMCTPKRFEFGSGRFSDRVFIEFEKCPALDSSNPVIHDLPLRAHTLNQYGCDRSQFSFPLTKEMASVIKLPQIEFKKPCQPYRIIWHLLVNDSTVKQLSCFLNGWRNPIGYACETRKIKHHAVAATVQGTDDITKCRVDGVTVLPTDCHGVLAVVMLMTFLPARFDCKLTIKRNRIRHVDLLNHKFDIPKNVPISGMILVAMNEIRHHLSELFVTTNDFCKIPESDLDVRIKHLIKLVSSIESSDDTALSEGSSTKVHISVYEGQKIQAHSNNEGCHTESSERHTESVQVNGDDHEFAFLKPFNLQNIGKHLGFEVEEVKKKLNQLYYEFRRRLDEQ